MARSRFCEIKWGGSRFTQEVLLTKTGQIQALGETRIAVRGEKCAVEVAAVIEALDVIDGFIAGGGDLTTAGEGSRLSPMPSAVSNITQALASFELHMMNKADRESWV
ncbi:hypothetical protein [Hyphobacterium sp.]|uniref:hypothetical protein n=1 Tax=Hyphobacterium sp. TaxID=2004662 RepID=UPI003BAA25BA